MQRRPASRRASARTFNRNADRTHVFNLRIMRGGFRL